jgi:4-hydroxy-tetrahydrodipicolinate reductase
MGREVAALAPEFGFKVSCGVSEKPEVFESFTSVTDIGQLLSARPEVMIDFSQPALTAEVAQWCARTKTPLVSGVTGLSEAHKAALKLASIEAPVLWSANMSLGVAVMARMLKEMAHLEGFDFQVEELHHKHKKDKPGGTALFLQNRLQEVAPTPLPDPVAIRGGGIFGVHRVLAMGDEEVITIEHTALNRRVFARGALRAATWLMNMSPGLYQMSDILSFSDRP